MIASPSFLADLRAAGRLVRFHSRREFRDLPLEMVLVPTMDAPVLVFESPAVFTDIDGRECALEPALHEARRAYMRTADPEKRKRIAKLLRRYWCLMVDQASYYTWPDAEHYGVPAGFEFASESAGADDADADA